MCTGRAHIPGERGTPRNREKTPMLPADRQPAAPSRDDAMAASGVGPRRPDDLPKQEPDRGAPSSGEGLADTATSIVADGVMGTLEALGEAAAVTASAVASVFDGF
jgi:hypothetical protein